MNVIVRIVAIVNFGNEVQEERLIYQITHPYECRPATNQPRNERMAVKEHPVVGRLHEEICNTDLKESNIYIYVISIEDLKKELDKIKSSRTDINV